jgi:hypothetical protein
MGPEKVFQAFEVFSQPEGFAAVLYFKRLVGKINKRLEARISR